MANIRIHPLATYGMQREFNRLFDTFFPSTEKVADPEPQSAVWRPTVDLHENAEGFIADIELPGLKKEDVKINFQDGTLSISGERKYAYEKGGEDGAQKDGSCHRMERFYGRFHRTFTFPTAVDADKIVATFEHGVLKVVVPKAEVLKPRQIEIA